MSLISEDQILSLVDDCFGPSSLRLGRGDDCAEFVSSGLLALSTDLFLEDVHFRSSYFTPAETGRKALAVNLSDLAAAGAVPLAFSLGLICPPRTEPALLRGIFQGMAALARRYDLTLSGGDISSGPLLGFGITIWGRPPRKFQGARRAALLRRGGRPGQTLFLAGPPGFSPGLARLGLLALEEQGRDALKRFPAACAALLQPQPQVEAGQALALLAQGFSPRRAPLFLMDLSDGLARDLPRLLRGLGADIDFPPGLPHPELAGWAGDFAGALGLALSGGDDYLLLGAADPEFIPAARAALAALPEPVRLEEIGRVGVKPGLRWRGGEPPSVEAFDHYAVE
jgi:thiamine-monophosphate kinase